MLKSLITTFGMLLSLTSIAFAQAANPLNLNQVVTGMDGKPIKNSDKRELKVIVARAFDNYHVGDVITDRDTIRQLATGPNQAALQVADPECDNCPSLDLRWVISEALVTRACPQANPMSRGETKPAECTPEEEKAENDVLVMTSRINKALEVRGTEEKPGPSSLALGAGSIKTLKALVAVRYKTTPAIIWRVWSILDPNGTPAPTEFGKE